MRKKILCLLCAVSCVLTGCIQNTMLQQDTDPENYYLQEIAHLHIEEALQNLPESESGSDPGSTSQTEHETIRAVWIPVMLYETWMYNQSETQFRENVQKAFQNCTDLGLNTIYLHVRAYCDAYYNSEIFPAGAYLNQNYDPLAIMLEEAHAVNLSVHAWINPLRSQTVQKMATLEDHYILKQWYDDPEKNGTYLVNSEGRYYLNPAYPEVRQLIADGITEILENYDVDGIHIDDYFYPTTDPAFDQKAFSESNAQDLAEWRRTNCSELVKLLYETVKNHDSAIPFSISPQGNFTINYDQLYADVKLWCSTEGYCDCIIPQLYYGFQNETCPFKEMVNQWTEIATATDLVIGLAAYKIGTQDQWAGSGKLEFLTDSAVIAKELEYLSEFETIQGAALYSYSSLFEPEQAVSALVTDEKNRISAIWD